MAHLRHGGSRRLDGAVIGIDTFSESAPAGVLYKHFGITAEALVNTVKAFGS